MVPVIWLPAALNELTNLWLAADSHAIDQNLRADPFRDRESRNGTSVHFVYPLGVEFEIDVAQRVVWIAHVWRFHRRGENGSPS